MEEYIRVSAKTVEDAVLEASIQLGTSSDNVEYRVIEKETKGFLGIGAKKAVIEARKKKSDEDIINEIFDRKEKKDKEKKKEGKKDSAEKKAEKEVKKALKEEKKESNQEGKKEEKEKDKESKKQGKKQHPEKKEKKEEAAALKKQEPSANKGSGGKKEASAKTGKGSKEENESRHSGGGKGKSSGKPEKEKEREGSAAEKKNEPAAKAVSGEKVSGASGFALEESVESKAAGKEGSAEKNKPAGLETEQKKESSLKVPKTPADPKEAEERAREFLTNLFDAMDMEVEIKAEYSEEALNIDLSGEEMGVLIGKRGQTLDSIQYLASLVVNKGKSSYIRVKLDTENYRNRRKATLENLARNIAYKVKKTRKPVYLEPMNPYERRIIHSALQNDPYVTTHSEGEEPCRKVVITPKKKEKNSYQNREREEKTGKEENLQEFADESSFEEMENEEDLLNPEGTKETKDLEDVEAAKDLQDKEDSGEEDTFKPEEFEDTEELSDPEKLSEQENLEDLEKMDGAQDSAEDSGKDEE